MPPILSHPPTLFSRSTISDLQTQWQNPADVLSILLILGGDVVESAIAQLSGGEYYLTPVAFSFGWVAYSISAVLSSWRDQRLIPRSDIPSVVINGETGNRKPNESWVLGRLLRDWEENIPPPPGHDEKWSLVVSILRIKDTTKRHGRPKWDRVMSTGVVTILAQCVIAAIPGIVYGAWDIMVITICGTLLALAQSGLPEWRREKWPCRMIKSSKEKIVCLTGGNGSNRVLVIISQCGLNLEDLASARIPRLGRTKYLTVAFAVLWLALLLTVAGIKANGWFLFAVGGLGMVQNILAVLLKREPSALGIHVEPLRPKLDYLYPLGDSDPARPGPKRVMDMLKEVERKHKGVGKCLLPVFFSGSLSNDEQDYWAGKEPISAFDKIVLGISKVAQNSDRDKLHEEDEKRNVPLRGTGLSNRE